MKKTKKLFFIALAVMLIGVLFCFSASALEETGQCGDNVYYKLYDNGLLVIEGTGDMYHDAMYCYGEYVSPFKYRYDITSLEIKDGVTSAGGYMFYGCYGLESAIIPESVTAIGYGAFMSCDNLKKITILNPNAKMDLPIADYPGSNTVICGYYNSIAQSYAKEYGHAFEIYCPHNNTTDYEKVEVTCTTDGREAGTYCSDCEEWITGGEVIYASHTDNNSDKICDACGEKIFDIIETGKCGDNLTYTLYENGKLVISGTGDMYDYTLDSPFYGRIDINSVEIKSGVTSIGEYIFYSCYSLANITIPDTVNAIGSHAFDLTGLDNITILNPDCYLGDSIVEPYDNLITIYGYKNSTAEAYANSNGNTFKVYCPHENITDYEYVAPTCTTDGREAGTYCSDCEEWLTDGEVIYASHTDNNSDKVCDICGEEAIFVVERGQCGDKVYYKLYDNGLLVIKGTGDMWNNAHWTGSELYYSPFRGRAEIKSVIFEKGITNVGSYLFVGCKNLVSISIPDGVTAIGDSAFVSTSLKEVVFPEGVVEIGKSVFKNCVYLEKVVIPTTVMKLNHETNSSPRNDKFENCIRLSEIVVLNPQCELTDNINTFPENATLYGYEGSTLQTYADDWNRKFVVIGSEEGGEEGGEVTPDTPDTPDAPHTHKFEETWTVIGEASCSQYGISIRFCEGCNAFETKTISAYGHADNDGDKKCDECGVVLEASEPSEPSEPTEPEAPEEKEEANVFSFLTEFLNKLMDFLKSLFKIG